MSRYFEITPNGLNLKKDFPKSISLERRIRLSMEKWKMVAEWHDQHDVDAQGKHRRARQFVHLTGVNDVETCALCAKFYVLGANGCQGCPVSTRTHVPGCMKTPYIGYHDAPSYSTAMDEWYFLRSLLLSRRRGDDGA